MNQSPLLLLTVGGSHVPILRAIERHPEAFVCFICSQDDPATGQKGSHVQITGKGAVIKKDPKDKSPSLPNIPTQAGLNEGRFEVLEIVPDNLDDIYAKVREYLAQQPRDRTIVADYTGGTKSMSAALVLAALDHGGVELQLVTGPRVNLRAVDLGEQAVKARVEDIRFQRQFEAALEPWQRYAWEESVERLNQLEAPANANLEGRWYRARMLSNAFADWDRFLHAQAHAILSGMNRVLRPVLNDTLNVLNILAGEPAPRQDILKIYDLWRNAQRRAAQQRYDDAVARLYRLVEWSAQWLLETQAGIKTADVPKDKIPPGMDLKPNADGHYQAGLFAAWELAAHHCGGPVSSFWQAQKNTLLNQLQMRNYSILAHGFNPVEKAQYQAFARWIETELLPVMLHFSSKKTYKISALPPQLPNDFFALERK